MAEPTPSEMKAALDGLRTLPPVDEAALRDPELNNVLEPFRGGYPLQVRCGKRGCAKTLIWGMPTYYLLKSGLLEKHGLKVEEFAVPSGNLTMQ